MTEDQARAEAFKNSSGMWKYQDIHGGNTKMEAGLVVPRNSLWMIIRCGDLLPDQFPDCNDEYWVYFVDGFYIRTSITVEFDDGGNPGAYPNITKQFGGHHLQYVFIPDRPHIELWIEDNEDDDLRDEYAVAMHEGNEYHRMLYFNEGYETAHGYSQKIESDWRNQWLDPDHLWTEGQQPIDVCPDNENNPGQEGNAIS